MKRSLDAEAATEGVAAAAKGLLASTERLAATEAASLLLLLLLERVKSESGLNQNLSAGLRLEALLSELGGLLL